MHEIAYLYDGSLEGLLTAVFTTYEQQEVPTDVVKPEHAQLRLGQEARSITTDPEKALRVYNGVAQACGAEIIDAIKHASLSDDPQAGTIVYEFIRFAMDENPSRSALINDFSHSEVMRLQRLNKSVYNERHYIMQFLRFEHMENNVWFAQCNPKASVVPLVMDWFSARFNTQSFIIYDENHTIAGVYEGKDWYLVQSDSLTLPNQSSEEAVMQQAWKRFYNTVAVESRYNPELRQQFMPQRFWKNITEMKPDIPQGLLQHV